jgi:hypothetical protein
VNAKRVVANYVNAVNAKRVGAVVSKKVVANYVNAVSVVNAKRAVAVAKRVVRRRR